MIQVGNVLVHQDIIKEEFVCNLEKCKGACCIHGNSGAPLEENELSKLEKVYPTVAQFLTSKGIEAIQKDGYFVVDSDGDLTTTCVDGDKECAYTIFDNGIAFCGIEQAYRQGLVSFRKPISCYLYPIRITKYPEFDVLHYDRWHICSSACSYGKELKVPVYKFLKEPLISKYGQDWYNELEEIVNSGVIEEFDI